MPAAWVLDWASCGREQQESLQQRMAPIKQSKTEQLCSYMKQGQHGWRLNNSGGTAVLLQLVWLQS